MAAQLAIVGVPGCGKTTLAFKLATVFQLPVFGTDAFVDEPWDNQPALVLEAWSRWGIIEGITVARLFRRGFKPDCVLWILGGDAGKQTASLRSLIDRGLSEYDGRVVTVPYRPKLDTVLWALGGGVE